MTVSIDRADFDDAGLATFLHDHLAELAPTAPAESRHALDLARLRAPEVRLWVATEGPEVVGTAALATVEPRHEELKSMRTSPHRRGQGIASHLLDHLVRDAGARGIRRISLETGSADFFAPARALYAGAGFHRCDPFGHYGADPHSVFMTRCL